MEKDDAKTDEGPAEKLTKKEARCLRELIGRSVEGLIRASEGANVGLFNTAALAAGLEAGSVNVRLMRGYLRLRLNRVHAFRLPVAARAALRGLLRSRDHLTRLGANPRVREMTWLQAAIGVPVHRLAGGEIAKFVEACGWLGGGHAGPVVLRWKMDDSYLHRESSAQRTRWTYDIAEARVFENAATGRAAFSPDDVWFTSGRAEFVPAPPARASTVAVVHRPVRTGLKKREPHGITANERRRVFGLDPRVWPIDTEIVEIAHFLADLDELSEASTQLAMPDLRAEVIRVVTDDYKMTGTDRSVQIYAAISLMRRAFVRGKNAPTAQPSTPPDTEDADARLANALADLKGARADAMRHAEENERLKADGAPPAWLRAGQRVRGIGEHTNGREGVLRDDGYCWVVEGAGQQIGKGVLRGIEKEWEPVFDASTEFMRGQCSMQTRAAALAADFVEHTLGFHADGAPHTLRDRILDMVLLEQSSTSQADSGDLRARAAFIRGAQAMMADVMATLRALPAGTWGDERGERPPWSEAMEAVRKLPLPKDDGVT